MHKKNLILIAPLIGLIIFYLLLLCFSEYQSEDCRLSNFEDNYSAETTIFIGHG